MLSFMVNFFFFLILFVAMYRSIEIWNSYQIRIPSIKSLFSGAIVLVSCCKWVESQVKPLEHCGTENTDTHIRNTLLSFPRSHLFAHLTRIFMLPFTARLLFSLIKLYKSWFGAVAGVYFAENFNRLLSENWKSFAGQNYFDPSGVFLSALWSGPLLVIAILILVSVHHFAIKLFLTYLLLLLLLLLLLFSKLCLF